mmetsp:Transcript_119476/g.385743  ORF Transcript_119476/g.385743 Transcript_119476/m.385743 type:complete len:392 (-) Transcript_119476:788-1963(-)
MEPSPEVSASNQNLSSVAFGICDSSSAWSSVLNRDRNSAFIMEPLLSESYFTNSRQMYSTSRIDRWCSFANIRMFCSAGSAWAVSLVNATICVQATYSSKSIVLRPSTSMVCNTSFMFSSGISGTASGSSTATCDRTASRNCSRVRTPRPSRSRRLNSRKQSRTSQTWRRYFLASRMASTSSGRLAAILCRRTSGESDGCGCGLPPSRVSAVPERRSSERPRERCCVAREDAEPRRRLISIMSKNSVISPSFSCLRSSRTCASLVSLPESSGPPWAASNSSAPVSATDCLVPLKALMIFTERTLRLKSGSIDARGDKRGSSPTVDMLSSLQLLEDSEGQALPCSPFCPVSSTSCVFFLMSLSCCRRQAPWWSRRRCMGPKCLLASCQGLSR